ncbi:hypothetical protein D5018_00065 [Parashewanella curva]|uniref:Uncharacterized protein n=1 Tax=Parashewanella curva TaxID=2338552 RepID=A0A3L8Q248_9GAMM|nr:hypothetical protein [Parashewanella curva]RLV61550.1 hypothetical protein D5018_00065 [Parashewanella curva]
MATCLSLNSIPDSEFKTQSAFSEPLLEEKLNYYLINGNGEQKLRQWLISNTKDEQLSNVLGEFSQENFTEPQSVKSFCTFVNGHLKQGPELKETLNFELDSVIYDVFWVEENRKPSFVFYSVKKQSKTIKPSKTKQVIDLVSEDEVVLDDVLDKETFQLMQHHRLQRNQRRCFDIPNMSALTLSDEVKPTVSKLERRRKRSEFREAQHFALKHVETAARRFSVDWHSASREEKIAILRREGTLKEDEFSSFLALISQPEASKLPKINF